MDDFFSLIVWVSTLKFGVNATLAGVLLALFISMKSKTGGPSPLKSLEHDLHHTVALIVLPIFAFANAGIYVLDMSSEVIFHSVSIGVALGLIVGKQVGVFVLCGLAIKTGFVKFPKGMSWGSLYGVSALCGIGFTMSLFIGSLAFQDSGSSAFDERLGIIVGSVVSGIIGYVILNKVLPKKASA